MIRVYKKTFSTGQIFFLKTQLVQSPDSLFGLVPGTSPFAEGFFGITRRLPGSQRSRSAQRREGGMLVRLGQRPGAR